MKKNCLKLVIDRMSELSCHDLHQNTIDLIEDIVDDFVGMEDDDSLTPFKFSVSVGSWHYRLENLLEVMDRNIKDYSTVQDILRIFDELNMVRAASNDRNEIPTSQA